MQRARRPAIFRPVFFSILFLRKARIKATEKKLPFLFLLHSIYYCFVIFLTSGERERGKNPKNKKRKTSSRKKRERERERRRPQLNNKRENKNERIRIKTSNRRASGEEIIKQ
jgi:hypothetical protein